jgi:hypothetical protein
VLLIYAFSSTVIPLSYADISIELYTTIHNLPMVPNLKGISDQQQQHPASGHCKNGFSQPTKGGQLQGWFLPQVSMQSFAPPPQPPPP